MAKLKSLQWFSYEKGCNPAPSMNSGWNTNYSEIEQDTLPGSIMEILDYRGQNPAPFFLPKAAQHLRSILQKTEKSSHDLNLPDICLLETLFSSNEIVSI